MTDAVVPTMRRQRKGWIINMSSIMGWIPAPYNALYASTKHAIEGYSESLDHGLRTFGIWVALVEPGLTRRSFEENLTKPGCSLAACDSARAGMDLNMRNGVTSGNAPEVVAETVVKAATVVPRRRYAAGRLARQVGVMRRFVLESAFDKSLRKHNHLPV